jgi:hypothetical protein
MFGAASCDAGLQGGNHNAASARSGIEFIEQNGGGPGVTASSVNKLAIERDRVIFRYDIFEAMGIKIC